MNELTYWAIFMPAIIVIGIFALKYLDGDFSYTDTFVERNKYTRTVTNSFIKGGTTEQVYHILIEKQYHSGRIKFITKEIAWKPHKQRSGIN